MKNDYGMITVREYAQSLKRDCEIFQSEVYQASTLITAKDYADALRVQATQSRPTSSLITVREYANALEDAKYLNTGDKEFEAHIEAYIQKGKKAEADAEILESLLA